MDRENKKWVQISVVLGGLIVAFVLNHLFGLVTQWTDIPNYKVGGIFPVTAILGVLIGGAGVLYCLKHEPTAVFLSEVVGEVRKVVWPTRKETSMSTVVVVIVVMITAVILYLFDGIWSYMMRVFISTSA